MVIGSGKSPECIKERVCEHGTKSCKYHLGDPASLFPQWLREIFHVCDGVSGLRNARIHLCPYIQEFQALGFMY